MPKSIVNGALLALGLAAAVAGDVQADTRIKRGAYLAAIMDCGGCHTPGVFFGKPDQSRYLGGSEVGFFIPELGYFYPPNLTPDPETGLGKWSEADIIKALFSTKDRQSVLGTYSIDENGDTTLTDYGVYTVKDGELVFDKTVKAQVG